jgi:hypothetical protein
VVSFLAVSRTKPCIHFSNVPYVQHAPPISSLIWSPSILVMSTNHEVPYFAYSSSLLILPPSWVSAPYSHILSVFILSFIWEAHFQVKIWTD